MNLLQKALMRMRHGNRPPMMMDRLLKRTRIDYRREIGDGLDTSVVTAPIMWVARALPEANFVVKGKGKAGKLEERPDHPMLALLQNPNPFYGDIALWMATLISFLSSGDGYWIIVRNGVSRPAELWYTPHWMMEPRGPNDGSDFISHYRYTPGNGVEPMDLAVDDVVHFRHGIDPRNPRKGLSPLDGVIREIFVDLESSNFVASLLRNMGVPGVVISPKTGVVASPEDVAATKTWYQQAYSGDNRGAPMVMGSPTDVQPFGFNPQQLNMSEGRDVAEERVCACLGIPAAVVGFGAGLQQTKVGATMEELRKLAWHNGVLPFARMLADELQRSLLGQFGLSPDGMKVCIDTSEVIALQEDENQKSDRALKQFQAGVLSFYQVCERIGEEVPQGEDFYMRPIASIQVPIGAPVVPPAPVPAPKEAGQKAQASEQALKRGETYARMLERQSGGLEKSFEQRLGTLFDKVRTETMAAAQPLLAADQLVDPGKGAKARQAKADDLLVAMILDKLGIPQWQGELQAGYEAQYLEVAKAVQDAAEQAGLGTSLPDVVARSIVAAGGKRAGMVDLADQTRKALFDALAAGRAAGEGSDQLAARIADKVQGGPWGDPHTRARVIARTETKYAQNISTIERARAAGVTHMIVFDGRLGPGRSLLSHIARNGSIVTVAEAVTMADLEHPNGTLSFAPSFEET